ncbi:unnamed protein product [Acanthoscelides obtectus]|uniref:Uncharacterized protein n=1 Tax=Acanthoscelides obtectus TaxID=200917 RepID=A0A9P0JJ60_ACAOB|nr:unnamed protein product [Acanthoscelides obtectus]CAK1628956.1 hypothetical protein AOBTE_LOCUS5486 [Acanthoscelides obtectus]
MNLKHKYCRPYMLGAAFVLFIVNEGQARKCYICGDEGDPPCKNFEMDKETFSKQCNPSDQACLLKISGRKRVRSCEKERIEDCKIANGVKYCFCTTDLCNDDETRFVTPTDDEDILEGSGIKMIPSLTEKPQVSVVVSSASSVNFTILLLLLSFLLILV